MKTKRSLRERILESPVEAVLITIAGSVLAYFGAMFLDEGIKNKKLKDESAWNITEPKKPYDPYSGMFYERTTYYGFDDNKDGITDRVTGKYSYSRGCKKYNLNSDHIRGLMEENNLK